jgi:hypothetical protein
MAPTENSPKSEPALEALAKFIDQLDIPVTTDEKLATEDREFPPALVDGKEPANPIKPTCKAAGVFDKIFIFK